MIKNKSTSRSVTGQIWRMAAADLQVGMIGRLLVHYKLGKPHAVRVPNSCSGIKTIEKYLKVNKAVLVYVAAGLPHKNSAKEK